MERLNFLLGEEMSERATPIKNNVFWTDYYLPACANNQTSQDLAEQLNRPLDSINNKIHSLKNDFESNKLTKTFEFRGKEIKVNTFPKLRRNSRTSEIPEGKKIEDEKVFEFLEKLS